MSLTSSLTIDPTRCPLCGRSNRCAVEAGGAAQGCWCMTAPIAPEALAPIPADQRNLACLCPECAAASPVAPVGPSEPTVGPAGGPGASI
ncbi:cysteine-rich CWC family protein [Acidovorax radicis]|uniref:cysteine-rich CWC family protein n=1 Tax=Acidovorax radicis TaxID=758826 RepID=UPI001CF84F79|nr:cysteine-rich CWC family protein [Acidovorax radicis]UCU98923.1 cysteine-rich CWC family protein [Acidovorax radicis]